MLFIFSSFQRAPKRTHKKWHMFTWINRTMCHSDSCLSHSLHFSSFHSHSILWRWREENAFKLSNAHPMRLNILKKYSSSVETFVSMRCPHSLQIVVNLVWMFPHSVYSNSFSVSSVNFTSHQKERNAKWKLISLDSLRFHSIHIFFFTAYPTFAFQTVFPIW